MGSLADDLAGSPPAVINKPPRGKRVSPLGPDDTAPTTDEANEAAPPGALETKETDMPRKKKAGKTGAAPNLHALRDQVAAAAEGETTKRKYTRRERPATNGSPAARTARFGVFNDGSVQVDAASCKGNLSPNEARELVDFIGRLEAK